VVHYFTTNSVADFYQTVQSAVPSVRHMVATGHSAPAAVFAALIGPVWYFIVSFVWRFVTDPITHACWAGVAGYFIGLAATRRHTWLVAGGGLAIAAVLHGLNDWSRVNGHPAWILIVIASGVLFLSYARVGARTDHQFTAVLPPIFVAHRIPTIPEPAVGEPAELPEEAGVISSARPGPATTTPRTRHAKPWWQP
jgi:hypothetical protein